MDSELVRDMLQSVAGDQIMGQFIEQRTLAERAALGTLAKCDVETARYQAGIIDGIGRCLSLLAKLRKGE